MFRTGIVLFTMWTLAQVPNSQQHEEDSRLLARIGPHVHPGCMRFNPKADPQDIRAYKEAFAREAKWHEQNNKFPPPPATTILVAERAKAAKQKANQEYWYREALRLEKEGKVKANEEWRARKLQEITQTIDGCYDRIRQNEKDILSKNTNPRQRLKLQAENKDLLNRIAAIIKEYDQRAILDREAVLRFQERLEKAGGPKMASRPSVAPEARPEAPAIPPEAPVDRNSPKPLIGEEFLKHFGIEPTAPPQNSTRSR